MTLETLFVTLVPTYLVLIAYGVVRGRRRGLPSQARLGSAILMVLIPPVGILVALYATADAALIARWTPLALGMFVMGAAAAWITDFTARRIS
ncbi:hypothetical protein [Sphingomonas sp.]|uniref:hypothetical protein n=1 Tax=Sphingomonas sp. TaxID=28214 RepID=UPI003B3ACE01